MLSDLRLAVRGLAKAPAFTFAVVAVLALGIGATTAIFSIVYGVVLKPLPFAAPDRLVSIDTVVRGTPDDSAYFDLQDWRAQAKSLEAVGGWATNAVTLTGAGPAATLPVAAVAADFFQTLGVAPLRGRLLTADDDRKGAPPVAVVSEGFWQRHFNRDEAAVGRSITLDNIPYTIVGIMPDTFEFPFDSERMQAWLPVHSIPFAAQFAEQRGASFLSTIARLRPGTSLAAAQAELETVAQRLAAAYPDSNRQRGVRIRPLQQSLVQDYRAALLVLLAAVAVVLLIACANVANLLLARGAGRRKEIAIRTALGAGRGRLVRQLLTESLVLSIAGGAAGILFATWGVQALVAASPIQIPRLHAVAIDRVVLAFAAAASIATAAIFGLVPALQISRCDAGDALKDEGRGSSGVRGARTRQVLVVAEMALSLVLLVSAGLLVRSLAALQKVNPGFSAGHVAGMQLMLRNSDYPKAPQQIGFTRRLLAQLQSAPGVRDAAIGTTLPLTGSNIGIGFKAEGQADEPGRRPSAAFFGVSDRYFAVMGIPLRAGRVFSSHDTEDSAPVIVINETMARRYWPGQSAIGKHVTLTYNRTGPREVVGVVGDVKQNALAEPAGPQVYVPFAQAPWPIVTAIARTDGAPGVLVGALRDALAQVDPQIAAVEIKPLDEYVSRAVATPRFTATLTGSFAALALLLAAIGLYGVMAYAVARRRREIGIRMALGAQPSAVRALVVSEAVRLGGIGLLVGLAGAFGATALLRSLLFGVTTTDPATFAGVSILLASVLVAAAYFPARRATRIDPVAALRAE